MNNITKCFSVIWVCGTIAACVTKDSDCLFYSGLATLVIGLGYLTIKDNEKEK